MKKTNKKLTVALLALLGVVSAGGTYAYWQGTVQAAAEVTQTATITIGEADQVTTVLNVTGSLAETGKVLVPAGRIEDAATEVETYDFTFNVVWENENTAPTGDIQGSTTLTVDAVPTLTGADAADYSSLVNVSVSIVDAALNLGEGTDVTVTVTLTEPANEAVYNAIINQEISILLTYNTTAVSSVNA